MRKFVTTLIAFLFYIGAATESSAQLLVTFESKADDFVKVVMEHHVGLDSCRDQFDPRVALRDKEFRSESYKYSRERDPLTPGGENHVQQWQLTGIAISALTYFGEYGPSTWLSKFEIDDAAVELDGNLKIGDSIDQFAEFLELSERMKVEGRLISSRADVTLKWNAERIVTRVIFECVAD